MSQLTYQSQPMDFSASERAEFMEAEKALVYQRQVDVAEVTARIADGARKNMILEFNNGMSNSLNSSYNANLTNPEGFKKEANSQIDNLLKGVDAGSRGIMRQEYAKNAENYLQRVRTNLDKANNADLRSNAMLSLDSINNKASIAVSDFLSKNNKSIGVQTFGQANMELAGLFAAKDSLGQPVLTPQQKVKAKENFHGTILSQFATEKMDSLESLEDKRKFLIDFENGKESININGYELDSRNLSQPQRNAIQKRLKDTLKLQTEQLKIQNSQALVQNVINGEAFPDPKSKEYVGAVDEYYKANIDLRNLDVSNPEQRAVATNRVGELINDTKAIPDKLRSDLRSLLNSDSPDHFALASSIVGNISINNPELMQYIPEKDISKALIMNEMITTGMSPKKAYMAIQESFSFVPEDVRKARVKDFDKNALENPSNFNPSIMEHGFWFFRERKEPILPIESAEFSRQLKNIVREEYVKGAGIDNAIEAGKLQMLKRWGNSSINGPDKLTALPPEKYYSVDQVGINSKWMRNKAVNYARLKTGDKDLSENEVVVFADKTTYQQAGDSTSKPTYALLTLENGLVNPILDENFEQVRVGENIWRDDEAVEMYEAPEKMSKEEISTALEELRGEEGRKIKKDIETKNKLKLEYQKAFFGDTL